jgi:hypothetical protein
VLHLSLFIPINFQRVDDQNMSKTRVGLHAPYPLFFVEFNSK